MSYQELGNYNHATRRIEWVEDVNHIRQWLHDYVPEDEEEAREWERIAVGIVRHSKDRPEIKQIFLPSNWVLT